MGNVLLVNEMSEFKLATKILTLDGTTPVTLFTVTGAVECTVTGRCTTNCAAVVNNLSVGIAGSTQLFIANTACQDIDAGELWLDATPATFYALSYTVPVPVLAALNGNDIIFTGNAAANSGVIEFYCRWRELSSGASVVAA